MCHPRTTSWLVVRCPVDDQWQRQDASPLQPGGLPQGTPGTGGNPCQSKKMKTKNMLIGQANIYKSTIKVSL